MINSSPLQLRLIDNARQRQTLLLNVPTDQCLISRFNTRKHRDIDHVSKLAQRMLDHGYETTRAVWACRNDAGAFEIFAGGTRLEAAKQAGIPIALILFEGYEETEISRLSDQDNENDEYHQRVSIVDVWAEYARLSDKEHWTQERIAQVKGKDQSLVAKRIALHRMPESIKRIMNQGFLDERHLMEIRSLCTSSYFSNWITQEQAWLELAQLAVTGVTKNGKKTVRATGNDVQQWKEFIAYAEDVYRSLQPVTLYILNDVQPEPYTYDASQAFVQELARREARNLVAVKAAERTIRIHIADNLASYEQWIQHKSAEAAREAARSRREVAVLSQFIHGDCLAAASELQPHSVRLLLMDPPYGQNYQSNRRWRSEPPSRLANDTEEEALGLLASILDSYMPALAEDAHLLIFCNWQNEPAVRMVVQQRCKVRGSLIWAKDEHSAGDLDCSFGPSHERIIHATQGRPTVQPRLRDVFQVSRELTWTHPTVKPQELLKLLIGACTVEGDLVIDPTAGIASTLVAAQAMSRRFWGCESDDNWHQLGCKRLLEGMSNEP